MYLFNRLPCICMILNFVFHKMEEKVWLLIGGLIYLWFCLAQSGISRHRRSPSFILPTTPAVSSQKLTYIYSENTTTAAFLRNILVFPLLLQPFPIIRRLPCREMVHLYALFSTFDRYKWREKPLFCISSILQLLLCCWNNLLHILE